jgi:crotonobetainyl-CoA:carnitine CoA-transferase CaiB-like acyl-CoA transferase
VAELLSDMRVIDLSTGPAGGMATMVLADFGADVVKVEPPGGDPYRRLSNAPLWLRGKRSVVLDLPAEAGTLQDLARGADVVVVSYPPGADAALGADYEALSASNPGLVYCAITGWGSTGAYARYPPVEALVAAKSGRMNIFRGLTRRDGPSYAAVQVGTHAAAQAAVQGTIAALLVRERLGIGQRIETSLLRGMLPHDSMGLFMQQFAHLQPSGQQDFSDDATRMPTLNYHPVMTSDGRWIQLGNLLEHHFYSFVAAAGLADYIFGTGHAGQPATWPAEAREAARDFMLEHMRTRTADEWMAIFRADGNVAAEPFATTQEALTNSELTMAGDVVETVHPRLGQVRQLGPLANFERTPGTVAATEPAVGEHTEQVLAELARDQGPGIRGQGSGTDRRSMAPDPRPPLDGVTILEFATIIAAPLAASMLSDLGARVIKVEPLTGDPGRGLGGGPGGGRGSLRWNAGKESICLDLKTEGGQEIVGRLLARTDIVIHNYRPGAPERLGIDYERARALNPRIVYLSANGYGPDAPGAMRPSAHPVAGALAGGAHYQAGAGMPPSHCATIDEVREAARRLMRANETNPDPNTSMVIGSAALLGLYAARVRGVGQRVFVDMMGANAYANHDDAIAYAGKPARPPMDADGFGLHALFRLYPARSGWVFLAVEDENGWQAFCSAAGCPDLAAEPRFAGAAARTAHDAALADALTALFARDDASAWEDRLAAAGVGCVCADADTPGTFFANDEHARANGLVIEADHPQIGTYLRHGPMIRFDRTPARCGPGSLAGWDTESLLAELGYDDAAIARLIERRMAASARVAAS